MAVNLTKVDHGAPNWEDAQNTNFELLNQDSGWLSPVIVAPFEG